MAKIIITCPAQFGFSVPRFLRKAASFENPKQITPAVFDESWHGPTTETVDIILTGKKALVN